ncbi:MAG: exodeoxyribonuclease VII small subunit [Opitutales bacterium]|nr:exodeoxyribonuclease VII small subunit [Opitutales bacterium]
MESEEPTQPESIKFEEALSKLETLVARMEAEPLSLDDLVNQYEEGQRLARVCQARLEVAETRIRELAENAGEESKQP